MARKAKRPVKKKAAARKPAKRAAKAAKSQTSKSKPAKKPARRKTTAAKRPRKGIVRRTVDAITQAAAPLLPGSATDKKDN